MKLLVMGLFGLLGALIWRRPARADSLTPTPQPPQPKPLTGYTPESWMPYLRPFLASTDIPMEFALGWIRVESAGNPCAYGSPGDNGSDGQPREQGITQLYNPDDFMKLGVPLGSFRVYCVPGTQVCSRSLTPAEMSAQARAHVGKIQISEAYVRKILMANQANLLSGWTPSQSDFWKLTKLVHGLPGMVNGFTKVTKELGHPPASWNEFKNTILVGGVRLDDNTERYRKKFAALFANAENVARELSPNV